MQVFTVFTALSLPLAWACPQFKHRQDNFTVGQIVRTSSGAVAGHAATNYSEVSEYLGIPYAQPPVRDLRFASPVKYAGSSMLNGSAFVSYKTTSSLTLANISQGSSCPRLPSKQTSLTNSEVVASNITNVGLELFSILDGQDLVYSEDCLYLNVWSKPQSGESQKAVMVFIYGGAFDGGTSSNSQLNGASLADQEDVIIVSFK